MHSPGLLPRSAAGGECCGNYDLRSTDVRHRTKCLCFRRYNSGSKAVVYAAAHNARFQFDAVIYWLYCVEGADRRNAAKIDEKILHFDAPSTPRPHLEAAACNITDPRGGERRRGFGIAGSGIGEREAAPQSREGDAAGTVKQPVIGRSSDAPACGCQPARVRRRRKVDWSCGGKETRNSRIPAEAQQLAIPFESEDDIVPLKIIAGLCSAGETIRLDALRCP